MKYDVKDTETITDATYAKDQNLNNRYTTTTKTLWHLKNNQ